MWDDNAPPPRVFPDLPTLVATVRARETVTAVYPYHDAAGAEVMAVLRMEPKSFRHASPTRGGWHMRALARPLPIFNRPAIAAAETVVVVEGERDALELGKVGVIATTAPGGPDDRGVEITNDGKPGQCDWSALAGKAVILWGDDDESGRRHMDRIARILGRLHPRPALRRVRREDLRSTKDAADFLDEFDSEDAARHAVLQVLERARTIHAAAPLAQRIEDAAGGRLKSVPWPWPAIGPLTNALAPGSVVMVAGNAGASKSFMLLQAALWWQGEGWRVSVYELEEPEAFWQNRALALLSGVGIATDVDWLALHADTARNLLAKHAQQLDAFAAAITTAPAEGVTLPALATWIEDQARAGVRVIIADPVSAAMESGDKPWLEAQAFALRVKRAADSTGASIILTTHGRKGDAGRAKGPPDLDSMAGGSAFNRFTSAVLWLEALNEPEDATVVDADRNVKVVEINRRIRILKARNGKGTGWSIGCHFDPATLRLSELGTIVSARESKRMEAPKGNRNADRAAGEDRADTTTT